MAVSASKIYYIKSYSDTSKYLDVYGNNTVTDGSNVITWSKVSTAYTQRWKLKNSNTNTKILSNYKPAFALDHWIGSTNYGKCDMYEDTTANDTDQLITLEAYNASQNLYKIKLVNHNKYLTAPTTNGSVMYWLASNSQNTQIWKFEEYIEDSPSTITIIDATNTVATSNYTLEYFSSEPGAITITSRRNITAPTVSNGEKKILGISVPFAQTNSQIKNINSLYGSSCKAFAAVALLSYYSKKLISPHWFT